MRVKRHRRRTKTSIWIPAVAKAKDMAAHSAFQPPFSSMAAPAFPLSREPKEVALTVLGSGAGTDIFAAVESVCGEISP